MARSGQPVQVECRVVEVQASGLRGVAGARLRLIVDGADVAAAATNTDGRVTFTLEPRRLGLLSMKAVLDTPARVVEAEGLGTLAVWERRKPLLFVEHAVLVDLSEEGPSRPVAVPVPGSGEASPGAVEDLSRLGRFFYNIVYLVPTSEGEERQIEAFRHWLGAHHFPPGVVISVPMTVVGIEMLLTRLKSEGWDNLRAAVGRSAVFAHAMVAQRLRTVVHTPTAPSDLPRKARVVSNWTSVRKHLQD